ncbi:MAG: colanic acid biosynthesis glycosyltransferase WcaL [Alphaproteobacteria bacterium]|nr:MAG: colanic acid biosynthesis glycosyltransferase WcaL [Alphaproteobacteria bacterium]
MTPREARAVDRTAPPGPVVFVLKGYPRLSETFIAQEILALERRGLDIRIVSLRHPTDKDVHPVHREIRAPVAYLPEYLYQEPLRVLGAWWRQRRRAGYRAAWSAWIRDLRRDPTANRGRRFGQALVLADELPADAAHLHAHFLHTPASVARYAALLHGLGWSCSAHAKDIWTTPGWETREKLAALDWLVTCTRSGFDHLRELAGPAADRLALVYHGLDFARFPAPSGERPARDGSDPQAPVRLLAVGRAVEKKGFDDLLAALARLPAGLAWRLVHVGGGPLARELRRQSAALGLDGRIAWAGPQPQGKVLEQYRAADLFVLPCRIGADGDRDGLPNVLMEAQSQGLAVVSTRISGVPELVEDGVTGLLVPPRDPAALAAALAGLIADPARRASLGRAGLERVRRRFDMAAGIEMLAARFGVPAPATALSAEG